MKSIFAMNLLFVLVPNSCFALEPSPCDAKLEARAAAQAKACESRSHKAQSLWPTLEAAKESIELAISKGDATALVPYVGCDSGDLSRLEVICEFDHSKLSEKDLKTAFKRTKNRATLKNSKWIQYGLNNDITLLCSKDYGLRAANNRCAKDEAFQPVIEVRRSKAGFYIYGVPLTGI